jgi:hypothetical protein
MTSYEPETAAFAMLIASWDRAFCEHLTVGEIAGWRRRFTSETDTFKVTSSKPVVTGKKGGARGRTKR